ncbi:MAG: dihydroneopterin aldolase [Acidimicrobiales bacterium]
MSEDRIELRDIRALGVHGVLDFERSAAQPFGVDVDAWFDMGPAGHSDRLTDTVDYGALTKLVSETITSTSFFLIERLASEIAERVNGFDPRIERSAVTVRKVRPPIESDVGSVGVRVVRGRRS